MDKLTQFNPLLHINVFSKYGGFTLLKYLEKYDLNVNDLAREHHILFRSLGCSESQTRGPFAESLDKALCYYDEREENKRSLSMFFILRTKEDIEFHQSGNGIMLDQNYPLNCLSLEVCKDKQDERDYLLEELGFYDYNFYDFLN